MAFLLSHFKQFCLPIPLIHNFYITSDRICCEVVINAY